MLATCFTCALCFQAQASSFSLTTHATFNTRRPVSLLKRSPSALAPAPRMAVGDLTGSRRSGSNMETIRAGGVPVEFSMQSMGGLNAFRRQVSGGIHINAALDCVWSVLTDYAAFEDIIPNVAASTVRQVRDKTFIQQTGVLSRKLNLRTTMLLEVTEDSQSGQVRCIGTTGGGAATPMKKLL